MNERANPLESGWSVAFVLFPPLPPAGREGRGRKGTDQHPPWPRRPGLCVLEPQAPTWASLKGPRCPRASWLLGNSAHPPLASAPVLLACKTLCQTPVGREETAFEETQRAGRQRKSCTSLQCWLLPRPRLPRPPQDGRHLLPEINDTRASTPQSLAGTRAQGLQRAPFTCCSCFPRGDGHWSL